MGSCEGIDGSALLILYEAVKSYRERSVLVYWVRLSSSIRNAMDKAGIFEISSSGNGGSLSLSLVCIADVRCS